MIHCQSSKDCFNGEICFPNGKCKAGCFSTEHCPKNSRCFKNKCLDPCDSNGYCKKGSYCRKFSNVSKWLTIMYGWFRYNISLLALLSNL